MMHLHSNRLWFIASHTDSFQPTDLEAAFAAALRVDVPVYMQPTSFEYQEQFWRPYLGQAFSLWRVLCVVQDLVGRGRWPSIEVIAGMLEQGNRHTILGREATKDRPALIGMLPRLVAEWLVTYQTTGVGVKQRYTFEVRPHVPMLTPVQIKTLPPLIRKRHKKLVVDRMPKRSAAAWSSLRFQTVVGMNAASP